MTLIEVLLAMIIFGIWIMSIFSAISWAIGSLQESSKKTTAMFLAKEWIDVMIYNKNKSLALGLPWDCVQITPQNIENWWCDNYLLEEGENIASYSIIYDSNIGYWLEKDSIGYLQQSNLQSWFLFLNANQQQYQFIRKITISVVPGYEAHKDRILKITSEVIYGRWTRQQTVILESYIAKTE